VGRSVAMPRDALNARFPEVDIADQTRRLVRRWVNEELFYRVSALPEADLCKIWQTEFNNSAQKYSAEGGSQ
jgi:hypothetical protein